MSTPLRDYVLESYGMTPALDVISRLVTSQSVSVISARMPSPRTTSSIQHHTFSETHLLQHALRAAAAAAAGSGSGKGSDDPEKTSDDTADSPIATTAVLTPTGTSNTRPASSSSGGGGGGGGNSASSVRQRVVTLIDYAANVLSNLSQNRSSAVQEQARKAGAFDTCEAFIRKFCPASYAPHTAAIASALAAAADRKSVSVDRRRASGGGGNGPVSGVGGGGGSITPRGSFSGSNSGVAAPGTGPATPSNPNTSSRVVSLPSINTARGGTPITVTVREPAINTSPPLYVPNVQQQLKELSAELEIDAHASSVSAASEWDSVRDVRMGLYGVLSNLITDNVRNAQRLLSSPILVSRLVQDCYTAIGHAKRSAAAASGTSTHTDDPDTADTETAVDVDLNAIDCQVLSPATELLVLACEIMHADVAPVPNTHVRASATIGSDGALSSGRRSSGSQYNAPPSQQSSQQSASLSNPRLGGEWAGRIRTLLSVFVTRTGVSDVVAARSQQLTHKIIAS